MTAPDPQALAQAADDAAVDALMQARYGVQAVADPSGMFGQPTGMPSAEATEDEQFAAYMRQGFGVAAAPASEPVQAPAPAQQAAPTTLPEIAQGPRSPAPGDDGAMVDEYVRTFWPQTASST